MRIIYFDENLILQTEKEIIIFTKKSILNKVNKKSIAVIGGGASALFFAAAIDSSKFSVTIYEKNKSLGRKFLVAGDGGFNLTHSEPIEKMTARYTPSHFLKEALVEFDNVHFQNWLNDIGIPTFIGSSKRIFPERGIKPIDVLNTILQRIKENEVEIKFEKTWIGWRNNQLLFNDNDEVNADIVVFALGGASWKVTGSDGSWLRLFETKGITTLPFQASNCAYKVDWSEDFIHPFEGSPLKNISASCMGKTQKGELVITRFGLEGNAIYALSPCIRKELKENKSVVVFLDLKPTISQEKLQEILKGSTKNRTKTLRDKIKLSKAQLALLKSKMNKEEFLSDDILVQRIKQLPLEIMNTASMDEAISTVGGIPLSEVNDSYELQKLSNHFCIGEMLDYDAPTGGYLLQSCFSMGKKLAHYLSQK